MMFLLFTILLACNLEFYALLIILIYIGAICVLFLFIIFTLNSTLFKIEINKNFIFSFIILCICNCIFFLLCSYFINKYAFTDLDIWNILKRETNYLELSENALYEVASLDNNKVKNWFPLENLNIPVIGGIFFFRNNFYCAVLLCWLLFYFVVFLSLILKVYKVSGVNIYSKLKIQNLFSQMLVRRKK
jgi:NADH-ubiquinone/plastoquinone oxidoreductase chain 6